MRNIYIICLVLNWVGGGWGDFQVNMVYNNTLIQKYHTMIAIIDQAHRKRSGRSGLGPSTFCQPLIFNQQNLIVPSMRRTSVLCMVTVEAS